MSVLLGGGGRGLEVPGDADYADGAVMRGAGSGRAGLSRRYSRSGRGRPMGERVSRSLASFSGDAASRPPWDEGQQHHRGRTRPDQPQPRRGCDLPGQPACAWWDTARTGGPGPSAATHGAVRVARISDTRVIRHQHVDPRPVNTSESRPPIAMVEVSIPPPTTATHGTRIIGGPVRAERRSHPERVRWAAGGITWDGWCRADWPGGSCSSQRQPGARARGEAP
jgi:hypothetical protein